MHPPHPSLLHSRHHHHHLHHWVKVSTGATMKTTQVHSFGHCTGKPLRAIVETTTTIVIIIIIIWINKDLWSVFVLRWRAFLHTVSPSFVFNYPRFIFLLLFLHLFLRITFYLPSIYRNKIFITASHAISINLSSTAFYSQITMGSLFFLSTFTSHLTCF